MLSFAAVHAASRQNRVGGLVLCIDFLFFQGNRGHKICQREDRNSSCPVTLQGGVGSRCRPARAIVRAVTATKHEPGLSPLNRVVSYGSVMEVWALSMRLLSHYQRARSEVFAVVPLWRAALTRWLSVAISAAKLFFFRCAQRNNYYRSRTCQFFMRPRNLCLRTK